MAEMEAKVDNLYEERLRCLQGKKSAYFEKALRASHLPARNANPRMTLPALFVQQHCDKIRESVELRNEATGRTWTVQLAVHYPRKIMQVLFYGRGWSDFAAANALVEGDRLIFVLRAVSSFGVHIFVKTAAPDERALTDARRKTSQTSTNQFHGCKIEDMIAERVESSVPTSSDVLARRRFIPAPEKFQVPDSASEVWIKMPLDSPQNSPNFVGQEIQDDSPFAQKRPQVGLTDDQKLRMTLESSGGVWISSLKKQNHRARQVSLPSFLKLLTVDNYLHYLEFPSHFTRAWGRELQTHVKLQGIYGGSAERIVACIWMHGKQTSRLFLADGWREFQRENDLEAGLVLGFTLTANSFFVVRGFHL